MRRQYRILSCLWIGILVGGCPFLFVPATAQAPAWARIAFESNREIYVMDADGGNPLNLTNSRFLEEQPSWSPDGKQIAFSSHRDGNTDIYVMDADGANVRNLSRSPTFEDSAAWFDPAFTRPVAPAGRKLLSWGWLKGFYGN